ncbi:hypothetical protein [Phyllobacterium sp. P5_D12]
MQAQLFHWNAIYKALPDAEYISGGQLLIRWGKKTSNRAYLKRLRDNPALSFPEPRYLTGPTGFPMWKVSEIEAWEEAQQTRKRVA